MSRSRSLLAAVALAALCGAMSQPMAQTTGTLEIAWNANGEPDLAGYRIYVDDDPNTFTLAPAAALPLSFRTIDVGAGVTGQIVSGLDASRAWFFGVTARDASGNESAFSNIINRQPSVTPTVRSVAPTSALQGTSNLNLTISGTNFVSTSAVSVTSGITVNSVNASGAGAGTLIANVDVSLLAQLKGYDVTVTNPGGSSGSRANAFNVTLRVGRLDIDGSGRIDGADFLDLLLGFPAVVGDSYYSTTRDVDVDGQVDGADLAIFFSFFGTVGPFP